MTDRSSDFNEKDQTIHLDQMSLDQLDQLKQREESRMQALTTRYSQLRQAAARLSASQMAVKELDESIAATKDEKHDYCDVFIPLTESVYVPGKIPLNDPTYENLLVELGTGYFVEKSSADTIEFLNRKIRLVDANSNNVTTGIQSTKYNLEQITTAMQGKLLEIRARQEGQRHKTTAES